MRSLRIASTSSSGQSVNQIYRNVGPGVVEITVDVGEGDWYTASQIRAQNVDVGLTLPREGAPGEIDLWMLGAHALHPGCAYRWMRYASGAGVQAKVARFYGATA